MKYKTELTVNGKNVSLTEYAHNYLTNILICAVSMFRGGEDVQILQYNVDGEVTGLVINKKTIPLTQYLTNAFKGIVFGIVLPLKGIDSINTLEINIRKI